MESSSDYIIPTDTGVLVMSLSILGVVKAVFWQQLDHRATMLFYSLN